MGGNQRKKESFCLMTGVAFISRHLPEPCCTPGAVQSPRPCERDNQNQAVSSNGQNVCRCFWVKELTVTPPERGKWKRYF